MTPAERRDALLAEAIEAEAWADMVAGAPGELASRTGLRCEWRRGAACLHAPGIPAVLFNRALGLGCAAPAGEGDLDEVLGAYRAAGSRRFWIHLSPAARPADLDAWLRARRMEPDPALAAWAKVLRGPEPAPAAATDLRVEPLGRGREEELGRVLARAHGIPLELGAWFAALAGRRGWRAYAALDAGRIVAGGLLYVSGRCGWLGAAGTLPSHRGRGGQSALLARRVGDAVALGCSAIATETGDSPANPSLRNMLRCGFRRVGARWNYAPAA